MRNNVIVIIASLFTFSLFFTGCFQFRRSNAKSIKFFGKKGVVLEADQYMFQGRSINFLKIPNPSDTVPVAIYVHGSPGSSQDFFKTMQDENLRANFELVTVDRPGFGHSGFGLSEPSLDSQAASIKPLLDQYAGRKIIIIGHSYGGPVVCKMAMKYSDQVGGLLIVAGSIDPALEPKEAWRKPADRAIFRWLFPRAMVSSNQEIMKLKSELSNMENDWGQINSATMVLQGTKDNLVPPGNADYAEEKITNSKYLKIYRLEGINHFIPFTYEQYIIDALFELKDQI
jgi:pimeloyl-ACP methyl ester carboxylesterase